MSRVLAAFIPNQRKRDADAVELPSKMLQLLAYGLPIVKTAMPNAVKAEFIILVQTDPALDAAIDGCFRNFSRGNRASARSSHSTRQKPASPPFESSPDADTADGRFQRNPAYERSRLEPFANTKSAPVSAPSYGRYPRSAMS